MKARILPMAAAAVAALFSLLTVLEGSQVLLGIHRPEYVVLWPLLWYNVIMGVVGFIAGVALWRAYSRIRTIVAGITSVHILVLLVVGAMFLAEGPVAADSVRAMAVRSGLWLAVLWVTFKTQPPPAS